MSAEGGKLSTALSNPEVSFYRQQPSLSHDGTEASLEHADIEMDAACIVTCLKEHGFERGRAVEGKQEAEERYGGGRRVWARLFPFVRMTIKGEGEVGTAQPPPLP